jgi:hypothetical protein
MSDEEEKRYNIQLPHLALQSLSLRHGRWMGGTGGLLLDGEMTGWMLLIASLAAG